MALCERGELFLGRKEDLIFFFQGHVEKSTIYLPKTLNSNLFWTAMVGNEKCRSGFRPHEFARFLSIPIRVIRAAQKRYGVQALGFEVNLLAYFTARIRSIGIKGVQIRWRNFWTADIGNADVVFCYLFPDVLDRLAKKFATELRPGSRVVSCNFPIPGWYPKEVMYPDSPRHGDPIYIYCLPESCSSFGVADR